VLLIKIRDGRQRATPEVAGAIAQALGHWATNCFEAASRLHRVLHKRRRA
jgi:hypothetical protein